MLNKNIQKIKLRKNKREKDEKKVAERERMLPRNRQVMNILTIIRMVKKINLKISRPVA